MNFNQLTIIGFIGKDAEAKQLPNGIPLIKFSVATTRSWSKQLVNTVVERPRIW